MTDGQDRQQPSLGDSFAPRAGATPHGEVFALQSLADLYRFYTQLPAEKYLMRWDAAQNRLIVHLNDRAAVSAFRAIDFAEKNPQTKIHIAFAWRDKDYGYDEIVSDLQAGGWNFARRAYALAQQAGNPPCILLTPPIVGAADEGYHCRRDTGNKNRQLAIDVVRKAPSADQRRADIGKSMILQIDRPGVPQRYGEELENIRLTLPWTMGKALLWQRPHATTAPDPFAGLRRPTLT